MSNPVILPEGPMPPPPPDGRQTYRMPFAIMTTLFFLWGFMTAWNDILVPRFKEAFRLDYFHAMLVQFAWGSAYTIGSLAYFLISITASDPIAKIGYKNAVIVGLLIAALGSALFYPAANLTSYPFFLGALFIVGLGFSLLQIAANPYVTILGPERTASSRLNLSQAFCSLGWTIGPIIGGGLIFTSLAGRTARAVDSVKIPYLCVAAALVLIAVFFTVAHLPDFSVKQQLSRGAATLTYAHTVLGMVAIFMYVGGDIGVGSAVINYLGLPKLGGLSHEAASKFLAFYYGGLMIGRIMGFFALSDMKTRVRRAVVILVPMLAFALVALFAKLTTALGALPVLRTFFDPAAIANVGSVCSWDNVCHFGILLAIVLAAFFLGEASPHRMLALFSVVIIFLLTAGMLASGNLAKWSILGVGLFVSIMWPNIFSLAIEGLGPLKSQGASLLMIGAMGCAVLPPLQGWVADKQGIQFSFIVPMCAFAYTAFYGLYGYRAGRQRDAGTSDQKTGILSA
jgi:FHS family L-fucose permease-like MFS transporter